MTASSACSEEPGVAGAVSKNCDSEAVFVYTLATDSATQPSYELPTSNDSKLVDKVNDMLYLDNAIENSSPIETDLNMKLANYTLDNVKRKEDGRLIIPLMWNPSIKHRLSPNYQLAKCMLKSTFKKLCSTKDGLAKVDEVFLEQERLGIIERVPDVESFLKNSPNAAFLAHMPVVRDDAATTKIRMVFLPNQKQSSRDGTQWFSNNQCILPGPNLNTKISTAVQFLRFDKYLLIYDLKKAFLNIELPETDQEKLLFLWFNNVSKNDFSIVAFKNKRLAFGIRCSPSILMISLLKILLLDIENDSEELVTFKEHLFTLLYVDNGGVSSNDREFILTIKDKLNAVYNPYQFYLQKYAVNLPELQTKLDLEESKSDPDLEPMPDVVKLLGVYWNRISDEIGPKKPYLDPSANSKRKILAAINGVYDILGIYLPILNKAKLFMQVLSLKSSSWDETISSEDNKLWLQVCKHVNKCDVINVSRSMGSRDDTYSLLCFSDASRMAYGIVFYLLNERTKQVSFLCCSNHFLSKALKRKTIPELEMCGVAFGTSKIVEMYNELFGKKVVQPVKIGKVFMYSDSMNTLQRIKLALYDFENLKSPSAFVKNCIAKIKVNTESVAINFCFIEGEDNPADLATRICSYNRVVNSNFLTGPDMLSKEHNYLRFEFILPHPLATTNDSLFQSELSQTEDNSSSVLKSNVVCDAIIENPVPSSKSVDRILMHGIGGREVSIYHGRATVFVAHSLVQGPSHPFYSRLLENCSTFDKIVNVVRRLLWLKRKFQVRVNLKKPSLFPGIATSDENLHDTALLYVLKLDQLAHFSDIFAYFENPNCAKNKVPFLVNKLNLTLSKNGLLQVKAKFRENDLPLGFPILLSENSRLTKLIIENVHDDIGHGGIYHVLNFLQQRYFFEKRYSVVKKILLDCVECKRQNARTIKLNQNAYKPFRCSPSSVPFKDIFLDYMSFPVYSDENPNEKKKVHVLIFTCLWSRAINLKVCLDATTIKFLQAFQSHVLDYGLPSFCVSDLGTNIVSGTKTITNFLDECETHDYMNKNNIKVTTFEQYPKGNSALGGLVEIFVKFVRHYLAKVLRRYVLPLDNFRYLVSEALHYINKRPIAFRESLRDTCNLDTVTPITPELLLKGYDVNALNISPSLNENCSDGDQVGGTDSIRQAAGDLSQSRSYVREIYHTEFLQNLIHQAVDRPKRYAVKSHRPLQIGDIILLHDKFLKPLAYPMGIIKKVEYNDLGESVSAYILKGATKEVVYRHASSLILLLPVDATSDVSDDIEESIATPTGDSNVDNPEIATRSRPKRKAAEKSQELLKRLIRTDSLQICFN